MTPKQLHALEFCYFVCVCIVTYVVLKWLFY